MAMLDLETLSFDLPEDVLKRKWAGDFEGELRLIETMLARDLPAALRQRLLVEQRIARELPGEYIYDRAAALALIRERIPDYTEEELDAAELERLVEYIYSGGEKHYHRSFFSNMLKVSRDLAQRAGLPQQDSAHLDEAIRILKTEGRLAYRLRLSAELTIDPSRFVPGALNRVYLPVPSRSAQQSQIIVEAGSARVDREDAPQRTAYFERAMAENEPFRLEYAWTSEIRYADPLAGERCHGRLYSAVPEPVADDLAEQMPHIAFTPFLRRLEAELRGDETDPVKVAWRFYDWITTHIRYSYMRSYALIDRQAEYCALSGKGDCGIQALLFITLCRIAGIPARWQSGLELDEEGAGCHDWAQFFVEPWGWLFCDPSFGAGAFRAGNEERRAFYFGNLDPFRMVANSRYQTPFSPPEDWDRADPYDNQSGEVCVDGEGLPDTAFTTRYRTLEFRKL